MSSRTIGRTVGGLILLAFLLYGGGSALVDSVSGTPVVLADVADGGPRIGTGVLMILLNSLVVAGIGVLVFAVIRAHHEIAAHAYLVTRIFEAVALAGGALLLLLLVPLSREYTGAGDAAVLSALARVAQDGNQNAYAAGMMVLGLGSLPFCWVLWRARLVPRILALWGVAGYVTVAVGMAAELLGSDVGLVLWISGGLFEVALGVLLLVRGFATPPDDDGHAAGRVRDRSDVLARQA